MSLSITLGVFLTGIAATMFVATFVATRSARPPWWVGDTIVSIATVPLILMLFVAGMLVLGAIVVTGALGTVTLVDIGESVAIAVACTLACRFLLRRTRAREAMSEAATVIPIGAAAGPAPSRAVAPPPGAPRKAA